MAQSQRSRKLKLKKIKSSDEVFLLVDRLVVNLSDDDFLTRVADSVQTAFYEGKGECNLWVEKDNGKYEKHFFSNVIFFQIAGIPFVLILLVFSAAFFTIYFGFPNVRYFWRAIQTVRGKYEDIENHGAKVLYGEGGIAQGVDMNKVDDFEAHVEIFLYKTCNICLYGLTFEDQTSNTIYHYIGTQF